MNADTLLDTSPVLPESIVHALRQLIRRARRLMAIRGLCASCSVGIGAFLGIMLIDASFTLLARWPRWLMTVMAYSAWAGSCFWFLIRPLARSFTLTGIARLIETHHPELQERLSSVVELLGSQDVPAIRGSDVLIGALTEEAVRDAVRLKPRHEISFRSAIPFAVAAGIVLTLLAALWLAKPRETRFLLARAAAPFLNLPNVHAADLRVEPGDTLIAAGSTLRISIQTANPAVTSSRLLQGDRRGREGATEMVAVPAMTNLPGRRFSVTLPNVVTGFRYRIHAGDALTRYFTVRVAIPPIIEHLDVRCRYPEYSRLGVRQERDGSGTIRALAGSEVTVSAGVNKPVSSALMRITASVSTNSIKGVHRRNENGCFYDFSLTLPKQLNGNWTLDLTDEIGLSNAPFEYAIQSIPDHPPVAAISNLRQRELHLNRDARLPVAYSAEDDLGVTGLAMVFTLAGDSNETVRSLPMPTQAVQGVRAVQGETQIAMDDLLFASAPRVTFRLRATDNLPGMLGGPQFGNSDTYTIILDERAASWKEQVLNSQEDRVQQGLKQVQQKLASARDQAHSMEAPLAQQPALNSETARKIDSLQDSLSIADNSLREIAADIDKGFFAALATNLTALADDHVSKAENLAAQLRLVDSPAERTVINSNVTAEIDTSLRAVESAIQEHDIARSAVRRAVELDRLADKQNALAQARLEQATPLPGSNTAAVAQAAAASNAWQKAQDQVADQLAAMVRETPGTPEQVAAATSNLTAQAARQAAELASRQTELATLTQQQTDHLQNQDRRWRELAARQDQLAALARHDPLSATQSSPMQQAAKDLATGNTEPALRTQAEVADALRKDADRLLEASAAAQAAKERSQDDFRQTAAAALQKADEGLKLARQAAQHAGQAVERAQKQADADAALVKKAEAAKKPELVRELTGQAAESREAAKDAKPWSQLAAQAADQAKRAATEVRQAAEEAGRQDQPEPARREAAKQAARAAEQVEQHAEEARAAAHQAAVKSAERGSPQERAVQAEQRALDAARNARQSALNAGVTAERARQDAEQAAKRADQAIASGAQPPQVQDARNKAADASAQAEATGEAAAKSRDEALQARQESRVTQQAADKTLWEESPKTAKGNAEVAETAAGAAQRAAWRAEEQARLAEEAAKAPPSDEERAARAAQRAAQDASRAEQAAAVAQKAAQAMTKPIAEARRLAEQAWQTGQNALAQSTGQRSMKAREEADRVQALADSAQAIAAEARQAATDAAEAGKKTGAAEANLQAHHAEQAAQQAGAKAEQVKTIAEQAKAAAGPKPTASASASEAQQAARQAQEASRIAQQAAQSVQQAVQKSGASAQQAEQQAAAVRQSAQQATQAAEKAAQQVRQSSGKSDEPEKTRGAVEARQKAQLAGQNDAAAQQAVQQTRLAAQQTQQAAQQSQQAAQAAQQATQLAQQAAQQAQQAASTGVPQVAQKARLEAEQAALAALERAQESVDAAARANASADGANDRLAALKLSDLAAQQEGLRREAAGVVAEKERAGNALRATLSDQLAQQQQTLATDAAELVRDLNGAHAPSPAVAQATQAAEATGQAAGEWKKGALPQAQAAATEARQNLDQLADTLHAAATPAAPSAPLAEQARLAEWAQRSEDLAARQDRLGREMKALGGDRPLAALQGQQGVLSRRIDALARAANVIRAQTDQVLARTQAGPRAGQAAREMTQAAQSADEAANQMHQVASQGEVPGPSTAQSLQQAAERTRQAQQTAAQNLKQAAQSLQTAAQAMGVPAVPPAASPRPVATTPPAREMLGKAYEDARQAAVNGQAADALHTAEHLAQAADQAAAAAQALGANARPATLQTATSAGGGFGDAAQVSEDIPSFARRLGIKLQDWLRLHGELKDDVLQASGSEGPEEYRPLIKRYFREVAGHGGEE